MVSEIHLFIYKWSIRNLLSLPLKTQKITFKDADRIYGELAKLVRCNRCIALNNFK